MNRGELISGSPGPEIRYPAPAAVYAADVSALADPGLYAATYAIVSPERRAKADRYLKDEDRRLSLGAELLLRYALKEAGYAKLPRTELSEYGKPYFPEAELRFNLSHSGTWALCAVSEYEIGCDVEKTGDIDLKIARFFAPGEYEAIMSEPSGTERLALFYRFWTLKESCMKATGLGMKLPLKDFTINIPGPGSAEEISVSGLPHGEIYSFREYTCVPGCACAVCVNGGKAGELMILTVNDLLESEVKP